MRCRCFRADGRFLSATAAVAPTAKSPSSNASVSPFVVQVPRLAAADTVDATLYAGLAEAGKATVVALLAAGHYRLDEEDAP